MDQCDLEICQPRRENRVPMVQLRGPTPETHPNHCRGAKASAQAGQQICALASQGRCKVQPTETETILMATDSKMMFVARAAGSRRTGWEGALAGHADHGLFMAEIFGSSLRDSHLV